MFTLNQQPLADSGANKRPPMLEKGNYILWESRFKRFLDNKLEEGDWVWRSIEKRPYVRPMISNPDNTTEQILEPLSKMTEDVCKNAKDMWKRIKRLMFGFDVTSHVRHSQLMDEFDKFTAKEGESLEYVYERLTTLKISTPTNKRLRTSLNTRNQVMIQDGRVDIQTKNVCYANRNARRQNRNQTFNAGNGSDESNQNVQRVLRTESTPGKANVQCYNCNEKATMLMIFRNKEFVMQKLSVVVFIMARNQPADDNDESGLSYDAKAVSDVNDSKKVHEQVNCVKHKTIIHTSGDANWLGYKNPERLKKAIATQPKMHHGEMLHSTNLKIDSPDYEETLKDVEKKSIENEQQNGST
uniref:Uncharacterized protein n=1 Tax=Tanacetum cinerariifolium TaxID=118510 RepID=A0A699GQN5_TANCI|nr:hypothetical protein [Tanacetum cinerariifolium]